MLYIHRNATKGIKTYSQFILNDRMKLNVPCSSTGYRMDFTLYLFISINVGANFERDM
jgi:hypothetical protein